MSLYIQRRPANMSLSPETDSTHAPRLNALQALRAIAALWVAGFHLEGAIPAGSALVNAVKAVLNPGHMGADIFFVLSGFVIALSARDVVGLRAGTRFLAGRLIRLYSGYWPIVLLIAVLGLWPSAALSPWQIFKSVFLLEPRSWLSVPDVAWSLSYELYFYVVLTVAYIAAPPRHRSHAVVALAFVLLIANTVWFKVWPDSVQRSLWHRFDTWHFFISARTLEFLAGVWIALLYGDRPRLFGALLIPGATFIALGLISGPSYKEMWEVPLLRTATFGGAGIGFLLCALAWQERGFPTPKWLVQWGDASYSLYLLHNIVLGGVLWLQTRFVVLLNLPTTVRILLIMGIFMATALLWFRFVENPVYRWARKRLLAPKPRSVPIP